MKLQVVLFAVCAVAWSEARSTRQTDAAAAPDSAAPADPCCYPRPPPNTARGLKKHANQCCEFPVATVWEQFNKDLEACKEERRKQHEQEVAATTTTTPASPAETTVAAAEEMDADKENVFDAEFPENSMENETEDLPATESSPVPEPTPAGKARSHGGHKGRGKGGKHHHGGGGKCVREAFEKQGWSNNGTVNWEAILAKTSRGADEATDAWIEPIRAAVTNCSQRAALAQPHDEATTPEPDRAGRHHGSCSHKAVPEKDAYRCIVNNAIMKCPTFPTSNEYCVALRSAHEKCQESNPVYGHKQFRWCKKNNKGRKPIA